MNQMETVIGEMKGKMVEVESSIVQLLEMNLDLIMILNSKLTKLDTFALDGGRLGII